MNTSALASQRIDASTWARPVDAGLLDVFRIAVWIRLSFTVLIVVLLYIVQAPEVNLALLIVTESLLLLGVLYWQRAQAQLGRVFLPLMLGWALITPLFGRVLLMAGNWQQGPPAALPGWLAPAPSVDYDIFAVAGFNLAWMAVPVVLASWQYARPGLFATMAVVTIGNVLIVLAPENGAATRLALLIDLSGRLALIGLVAIVVERLAAAQRREHLALQTANRRLADRAAAIEQLTESRERNRLAREIHDTLAHTLTGLSVQLQALGRLMGSDPAAAHALLKAAQVTVRDGIGEARRAIQALRATPLDDLGLSEALRQLCRSYGERLGIAFACRIDEVGVLEPAAEQALYRTAEAALANVEQHAGAAHVVVNLSVTGDTLTLTVQDDGAGFDPSLVAADRYGLAGMRERADAIGARLTVRSGQGQGTQISLALVR